MKITPTPLGGAYVLDIEPHHDERGYFARTFCVDELGALGLDTRVAQASISFNQRALTLRGMHFQFPPVAETKVVRCTQGRLYDVIVDLRPESPTFGQHVGVELTAANQRALYIPERFAHGFLTLDDETVASYLISERFTPGLAGGLRFDDPELGIEWPAAPAVIADRDRSWEDLREQRPELLRRMAVV